ALAGLVFAAGQAGAAPRLTARAALVMDAASGETIWARNADDPLPPASTTKILTAILALESGRLDERFAVSEFAADTAPSKINLRPGQRMQLRDLVYAVLLNSANDAAAVVAEGLAGSPPARRCFVGAATHDGREIIIALLGASDLWGDAKRLFAYGFGSAAERPSVVMAGMLPMPSVLARRAAPEEDDETPEARAASRFAVQLGPYPTRRSARAVRARLARRGY